MPSVILAGVRIHVSPKGERADVSATVPVKPLTGATVIVVVVAVPASTPTVGGLVVTEKSATEYVAVTVCEREPLVPATDTV